MKRQECLSSLQSVDSENLCAGTEAATNGTVGAISLQPPPKSCRVGIAYWSVPRAGTKAQSKDCQSYNGVADPIDRNRLDSALSEGEQVNVFAVDEVIQVYSMLLFSELLLILLLLLLQRVSIACYAKRCISYSKSVRLSERPSVRLSVTRWH